MIRRRLFMGATALLYLGPLLAGLSGFGWRQVPIFVLVFLGWLVVMHPGDWPGSLKEWRRPQAWLALATRLAVQVLLVIVSFGIGSGLGGVLGVRPLLPEWGPLALSLASIPLGRSVYNPAKAAELDSFLDDAIARIEATSRPDVDKDWTRILRPILDLRPETSDVDALEAIDKAVERHGVEVVYALRKALEATPVNHAAARRAAVLWATEGPTVRPYIGCGAIADAFQMIDSDPVLLKLFASRATALLTSDQDFWLDCPTAALVHEAAAQSEDRQAAAALLEFVATMAVAAPQDDDAEAQSVSPA